MDIKLLLNFLKGLRSNNNREWFKANKECYDKLHKEHIELVQQMINRISVFDPEIAGLNAASCIYRIYRDLRFSYDKTPYKVHFGAYMCGYGGRTSSYGGYYLHLEPGNNMIAGGVWCPDGKMLKQLRRDIYDNIEEFTSILNNKKFKKVFGELEGDMLSRLPDGYPKDTPYSDILKHKQFLVSAAKPDDFFNSDTWLDKVIEEFRILYPFNKFLNYTVGEFYEKNSD